MVSVRRRYKVSIGIDFNLLDSREITDFCIEKHNTRGSSNGGILGRT